MAEVKTNFLRADTPGLRKLYGKPNKQAPYFRHAMSPAHVNQFLGKNNRARTRGRNFDMVQKVVNPNKQIARLGIQSTFEAGLIRLNSFVKRWKTAAGNYFGLRDLA